MGLPLDAPFGTWPKDLAWESVAPPQGTMPLSLGCHGRVDRLLEHAVVTKRYYDAEDAERIWNITNLAGECSVACIGRLFECGRVYGICMPIETPIDPENIGTREERIHIIYQLRDLVTELHKKRIIHGDIKPQNLLMCSDNRVRFCDFDNASIEGDGFATTDVSFPYCTTYRARNDEKPMTLAEDIYAMGISMWHLYTGKLPLINGTEPDAELDGFLVDYTFAGVLPDMTLIDDPDIASLINTSLAAGPNRPDVWDSGQAVICIETRFAFDRCTVEPPHMYSRIVHSLWCLDQGGGVGSEKRCEHFFIDAKIFASDLETLCLKCNPRRVQYTGLA